MNDVTVNDNNGNGYEMKNIARSRKQKNGIRGIAYTLRRNDWLKRNVLSFAWN